MISKTRKIAIAALSLTMAATITASQIVSYAYEPSAVTGAALSQSSLSFQNVTDSVDTSKVVLDNLSGQVVDYGEEEEIRTLSGTNATETVIVNLKVPSLTDSKNSEESVEDYLNTYEGKSALKNIRDSQNSFLANLSASGIAYKEVGRYSSVINAVAIEVNLTQFQKIRTMSGVSMAGVSKTYAAVAGEDAQVNPSNVYETGIYDSSEIIEKYGYDGSGVTVAILDTGLDYTHVAFETQPDKLGFDREHVEKAIAGGLSASKTSPNLTVDDVYLSDKVPFAYDYADKDTDVYPSYSQHGVHVAGIVAGSADYWINKDGEQVGGENDNIMDFMGVAPQAQLVICKVFTDDLESEDIGGATSEDIIAALDDCVTLGVDIINMSLGTTSGFSSVDIDGDEEGRLLNQTYQSIKDAGISLIAAAGNEYSSGSGSEFGTNLASNPDSGTVGSPSTFVGAMSVASINGQQSDYMLGNPGEQSRFGDAPLYYTESNDANSVPFNFADELLGDKQSDIFTYYVIPGTGAQGDYPSDVVNALRNKGDKKILVVVRRGTLDFQTKVENAHAMGADGIIIYDNVPGTIRMSLGEIEEENRIPAVCINMDAGAMLTTDPNVSTRLRTSGTIEINKTYKAGPFMNDYSSWGSSPDLQLKPDITSHGGEITSSVAGGYEQMSGTSMATPNLAGLMALVKDYLKEQNPGISAKALTTLTNQIVMSSATLVYDEEKLPYSPRKQGAGLATLSNIFTTKAYLKTVENQDGGTEDNRPKIELGEDEDKKGEYTFTFYVNNFDGEKALEFELVSRFFTETIAADKLAVAEAAYMLTDNPAQFEVTGATRSGDVITVNAGQEATIKVTLKLSDSEKKYLNDNFKNGMYVEGFISLVSKTEGQCDLNLPFMGFYGDWDAAPLMDYNAYEIAAIEADTSLTEEEKPHESVFATQLYSTYYNGRYGVPMGSFAYVQDDTYGVQQIYASEEHCSVSRYNIFNGATATDNYLTSTGIRSLYAGLLRNAELVDYSIYDDNTGELIYSGSKYRVGKAIAGGGSARPALVDLKLTPDELGLVNNGKYRMEFNFYRTEDDKLSVVPYDNNFTSTFYVDYDAPVLEASRIRYYDYKEGNKNKQRVYLDLDIYDNHYPQAVLICYSDREYSNPSEVSEINLATEYVTPIYNPTKNGTTTVSLEITEIYEKYKGRMYIQIDDYALNHNVYTINFDQSNGNLATGDFDFVLNDRVTSTQTSATNVTYNLTLEQNELYRVELNCGDANASNYSWTTLNRRVVSVKNNEIFGLAPGTARVSVTGGGKTLTLNVTVTESTRAMARPSLSFDVIQNSTLGIQKATGMVEVNAGQNFALEVVSDPWYYPVSDLTFSWASSNEQIATVDQNGNVTTLNEHGNATITATASLPNGSLVTATVTLNVAEPFTVANMYLNKYHGSEKVVKIPDDKNIMYIDEEAFEDNDTMETVIIPRTVTQISERAFLNCTALKNVYFIEVTDENSTPQKDLARLNLILADAFQGCTNLELLDLTNVKVITVGASAFENCENLKEIRHMEKIGIADSNAFRGCTSLSKADITGLHTAAENIFAGCTELREVVTDHYTAISQGMFYGCTGLQSVTINAPRVNGGTRILNFGGGAFQNCTNLTSVTFGGDNLDSRWSDTVFRIDPYAFAGCTRLSTVTFNYPVSYIGDYAFAGTAITNFKMPAGNPVLGESIFDGNKDVTIDWTENGYTNESDGAVYDGTTLVLAPNTITSTFKIKDNTTEIAPYAFASSTLESGVTTVEIPASVEKIGEGAFAGLGITEISIPDGVTEIPAHAFRQSGLTSISIHSGITSIGESAFANCSALNDIDIIGASSLKTIGSNAFSGTAISSVTLPASVKEMGDRVFANCRQLTEAHLPSLTALGEYTFVDCPELAEASFGADATASGTYTFCPGINFVNGVQTGRRSSLTSVSLGGLKELGEGMFWYCTELTEIDLKDVTVIGRGTFQRCSSLANVKGLENVTEIGVGAFGLTGLTSLKLTAATDIGEEAFYNVAATSIEIPAVKSIGPRAFYGIAITVLSLPATLQSYGDGAFMNASHLSAVTMDGQNEQFFAENNVLYRNIKSADGTVGYELCLYPTHLTAVESENYLAHYRVKDGTVNIQAQAFADTAQSYLTTVTLPYSLKTIGDMAFYGSHITRFNFESIEAPVLLSNYWDLTVRNSERFTFEAFHTLYFRNFGSEILDFIPDYAGTRTSNVILAYPSNGTGYSNYTYSYFFGSNVSLGELMDDNTRDFIGRVDGFDISKVNGWLNLEVTADNVAMVTEFSESVKTAHRIYNDTTSEKQLEFMTEERIQKLFDVEEALKPVKSKFNIPVTISSVTPDVSSAHKSEYVEGEIFDITGLVLRVVYDDYSVEIISDISGVVVSSAYTGPLQVYDTSIACTYNGQYFRIPVTVTAKTDDNPNNPNNPGTPATPAEPASGCGGCGSVDTGSMIGGTGLMLLTLAGTILLTGKLRRRANKKIKE